MSACNIDAAWDQEVDTPKYDRKPEWDSFTLHADASKTMNTESAAIKTSDTLPQSSDVKQRANETTTTKDPSDGRTTTSETTEAIFREIELLRIEQKRRFETFMILCCVFFAMLISR